MTEPLQDQTKEHDRYRICPICEAGCGLRVTMHGETIVRIRGNDDDRFSEGHLCPKGVALVALQSDPRRLRKPRIRDESGTRTASWHEAFAAAAKRLSEVRRQYGNDSVAIYIGNPSAHNVGLGTGLGVFAGHLGSRNLYSAASVDQMPKQLASELMFGNDMAVPVPDIVHTDFLLMLGANPVVSNGSLWMVPKFRDKVQALHKRGGRLVVVDPRRTETARLADQHLALRPGSDAWLLAAVINELVRSGSTLPVTYSTRGFPTLVAALAGIDIDEVVQRTGLSVERIRGLAADLRSATSPVVYGRIGTTLQVFGTLTSFLIETLNLLLGSLDVPGGALFGEQVMASPTRPVKTGIEYGRWFSRVSGRPEVGGQLPVVCLAEEIETEGPGQIRALVCFAGNPLLSNPDSERLRRAIESLELIVAVDIFDSETAALAHVLLPGTSPFEESHYDHYLGSWGWKNVARYSAPLVTKADRPDEWGLCLQLAYGLFSNGEVADGAKLAGFEDDLVAHAVHRYVSDPMGSLYGRDVQEILGLIEPPGGVERMLDLGFRAGPFGDAFGMREGLTLGKVEASPDGIELGALRPRLVEVMRHADGVIDLAPPLVLAEVERLKSMPFQDGLLLTGRRNVKSNNSWLTGIKGLDKGVDICVIEMNEADAKQRQIAQGDRVRLFTEVGSLEAKVVVGDDLRRGVVCLPHGFARANYNQLASTSFVDEPTGTAALNGIVVEVERIGAS
jgi:anaerobic selenocysteine-containing dehydrogenase